MITAMRVSVFGVAAVLVLLAAGTAAGDTYVVQPDGFGDYPTIQAAVDAAAHGDIIELADGTFTGDGNRDIVVPAIYLRIRGQSANYMNCIIDCGGGPGEEHRGFHLTGDLGTGDVTIMDISIMNGYTTSGGGGIWIEDAEPEIRDCAVAFCTAVQCGGGICVTDYAAAMINSCLMVNNTADNGGGLAFRDAAATVSGCEIGDNVATGSGGGVYFESSAMVTLEDSDITSNEAARGGGVHTIDADIVVTHCNISRNEATEHSGGVWLQGGTMYNCTLVENSAPIGGGVYAAGGSGAVYRSIIAFSEDGHGVGADVPGNAPYLQCCDVHGNVPDNYDSIVGDLSGTNDNFSQDPELCGREIADYRLFDTSICLEDNSPCMHLVGRWGIGCDSPVEKMSWGRLKGMWR